MSNMVEDQAPGLEMNGGVATLTLRRPSKHNRIMPGDSEVISQYLAQLKSEPEVRVLVIRGTGCKTFSSGYTLGAIQEQLDSRFEDMLDAVEFFPLPTICALNGSVYGGATDLALSCDFRIGMRGTRYLMPACKIGVHYYPGGIRRYVTLLGLAAAKKLFLTAQAIDDEEALRIGFLQELVTSDQLEPTVRRYIDAILACEPKVLVTMKADLMKQAAGDADLATFRGHYEQSLKSPELAARLGALEQQRKTTRPKPAAA